MFKYSLPAPRTWCLKYFIPTLALFLSIHAFSNPALAGPDAHLKGEFGPLHDWPIIPLAMMLMPDGRVFAYGTTPMGVQNAKLHYAIWDPSAGTGASAFEVLPNITNTDIFCAGQALIPGTGHALIVGGRCCGEQST